MMKGAGESAGTGGRLTPIRHSIFHVPKVNNAQIFQKELSSLEIVLREGISN